MDIGAITPTKMKPIPYNTAKLIIAVIHNNKRTTDGYCIKLKIASYL